MNGFTSLRRLDGRFHCLGWKSIFDPKLRRQNDFSPKSFRNFCSFFRRPGKFEVHAVDSRGFFIFIFFNFIFYKNIFLFSKFTGIYLGRPAAERQGLFCKKVRRKFAPRSLEDRSSGSGAAGPPGRPAAGRLDLASRLRGDHLPFPSKRAAPLFGSKIPGKNTRFVVKLFIHHIIRLTVH